MVNTFLDHLATVQEFADIRRGDHPAWKGDRIANGEAFAFRIGYDFPLEETFVLVQSLHDAETEYSKLTGLPPRSLQIMAAEINHGRKAQQRDSKRRNS